MHIRIMAFKSYLNTDVLPMFKDALVISYFQHHWRHRSTETQLSEGSIYLLSINLLSYSLQEVDRRVDHNIAEAMQF